MSVRRPEEPTLPKGYIVITEKPKTYHFSRPGPIGFAIIFTILMVVFVIEIAFLVLSYVGREQNYTFSVESGFEYIPATSTGDYGVLDAYAINTGQDSPSNPCFPGGTIAGANLKTGVSGADNIWLCQEKGNRPTGGLKALRLVAGTHPNLECPEGFIRNDVNLNSGAENSSTWIYLCRQYGEVPYIQDVNALATRDSLVQCPSYGYFNISNLNTNLDTSGYFVNICVQLFFENALPSPFAPML